MHDPKRTIAPRISDRTSSLGTENAFVVLKEVKELMSKGVDIKNFCIGQPDFDTPRNIKEAGIKAIREGKTGYTESPGIRELREAIANHVSRTRHIDVSPDSVVVTCGVKPLVGFSILATTDHGKGDEVLYPNPGYPIYQSQIIAHGAVPVPLNLLERNKFSFSIEELERKVNERSRLLLLNSPENPTGGVLTRKELEQIAEIVKKYPNLWVFSDEVYSRILYEGQFESIASVEGMQERTIIADGCSKTYAMTGWRIGFGVSERLAPHFSTWNTNTDACAPHMNQYAALEALAGPQDEAEKMVRSYKERRDLIVEGLNRIPGIKCLLPKGTFYVWPNVTEACRLVGAKDSEELRKRLLKEAKVATLSDIHFGSRIPGEGEHLRFSYVSSLDDINEGLKRVKNYIVKAK